MGSFLRNLFGGGASDRSGGETSSGKYLLPAGRSGVYRAVRTASALDTRSGKRLIRSGVGMSVVSQADAEQLATKNAEANARAASSGAPRELLRYAYSVERSLEPLFETLASPGSPGSDSPIARVTVNSYGALAVNAERALFVDVDTSAGDGDELAAKSLADLAGRRPELGFRVYRTKGGWRYLCTTHVFDPEADATRQLLEELQCDPKYRLLCRIQKCFRARLTPKPWRSNYYTLSYRKDLGIPRKELDRYLRKTDRFATAQFVSAVGSGECLPELAVVRDYHDRWTQADSGKPLA